MAKKKGKVIEVLTLDDQIILFCAFRYALGRRTYVSGVVSERLISLNDSLSQIEKDKYISEIKEAIEEGSAGDDCDIKQWKKVMSLFNPENHVKIKAYHALKSSFEVIKPGEKPKKHKPEIGAKFEIVTAVKMDDEYYEMSMKKTYHTAEEI
jgi:hypothetical protein